MIRRDLICAIALPTMLSVAGTPAVAEVELSVYGGYQTSPHSVVSVFDDAVIPESEFTAGWEGRPFDAPPYYGLRATWWPSDRLGFGLDMNHAKVYADAETLAETGYEVLEFSDGLNIITLNAYRSWEDGFGAFSPYVGGGLGVSFPHVEVTDCGSETVGYQLTGPAVACMSGASVPINDIWSVFGEYKCTYSLNSSDLEGGGTLETNIITNAVSVGVSFNF